MQNEILYFQVAFIIGISGACRREELTKLRFDDIENKETVLLIRIPETKNNIERVFTVLNPPNSKIDFLSYIKKYIALRPPAVDSPRFFLKYCNNKCTKQPVGINSFGKMPSVIAKFLNLPNPTGYTGHCFRRSSATMLANSGGDLLTVKKHGGWKSSTVAEGYVDSTLSKKNNVSNLILMNDTPCSSKNIPNLNSIDADTPSTSKHTFNDDFSNSENISNENLNMMANVNAVSNTAVSEMTLNSVPNIAKGLNFNKCTNCTFNINIVNN